MRTRNIEREIAYFMSQHAASRSEDRPPLTRRANYKVLHRQDRWIVPLLAANIEQAIRECAATSNSGASCLDVGCGEQPLRLSLEASGFRYASLDVEQNAAGNVDHIGAIDAELPATIEHRSFDFILCTEVLEHVANWPIAFANLAALLKPGGRLLITCPHIWIPHEEPADFFRPTDWAFAYYGKLAGLRVLRIARLGDGFDVLGTVLAAVRVKAPNDRPWMWLLAGPLSLIRKLTLGLLSIRPLRRSLHLPTTLYLSTIAIFEKPQPAAE